MMSEVLLNGNWQLIDRPLGEDCANAAMLLTFAKNGWFQAPVPGGIHEALIASGRIQEPLIGRNSFDCQWTEARAWWYRREIPLPEDWQKADAIELELHGLDSRASVFLNEHGLGTHPGPFRPFVTDVKPFLNGSGNILLVRLTSGVESVSEAESETPDGFRAGTESVNGRPERGDARRSLLRKPQYSFGWDWSPRLATTGIAGDARLKILREACIRHVRLTPVRGAGSAVILKAEVTVDLLHSWKTAPAELELNVTGPDGEEHVAKWAGFLRSGINYLDLELPLQNPRLWWPNGYGDQPLYRVGASLRTGAIKADFPGFDYGIRFVELETEPGIFAVKINGVRVFCKGANWIPADALYTRVTPERYESLVQAARDAHFTMLRIWGGGLYEHDAFYHACDRLGILVWQDFMYACAPYPDHLEDFRAEVEREADFQTQRLRQHASIVLWCGNNEIQWGWKEFYQDRTRAGSRIYNWILPAVVRRNCPEIPYWNSSPYGGQASPNEEATGDRHHWLECMMNPDIAKRVAPEEYDQCRSLFVSEYGYIGAPVRATIEAYLDGAPFDRNSEIWQHHNNTFEKNTVDAGIRRHYRDPENLSFDEYCLYSGLCQGLMIGYSLESFRFRADCHGGLFWMFNDCWGEIGWSIIDYYLRRKPSFYFVRRALAPLRLILRPGTDGEIRVVLANDTLQDCSVEMDVGYVSMDGKIQDLQRVGVDAPAASRTVAAVLHRGGQDPTAGLWVARPCGENVLLPGIFRATDFRNMQVAAANVSARVIGSDTLEVRAETYAHAVHPLLPDGCVPENDYFDLLPGEVRHIRIHTLTPLQVGGIFPISAIEQKVKCNSH